MAEMTLLGRILGKWDGLGRRQDAVSIQYNETTWFHFFFYLTVDEGVELVFWKTTRRVLGLSRQLLLKMGLK
jgi:hypothetical protein